MAKSGANRTGESAVRRYFTVAEANESIADLIGHFQIIMQLRTEANRLHNLLAEAGYPATTDSDDQIVIEHDDDDEDPPLVVLADAGKLRAIYATVGEQVGTILDTGAVIKDLGSGLIDWLSIHQEREIWLCWQFGERQVSHWHELRGGLAGRRPISELEEADE